MKINWSFDLYLFTGTHTRTQITELNVYKGKKTVKNQKLWLSNLGVKVTLNRKRRCEMLETLITEWSQTSII